MFGIFKKLFNNTPDTEIVDAINAGAYLVDVRTPSEFAAGHVKDSINIPLDKLQSQLNKLKNKKHIVVFCQSGGRSAQARAFLSNNGVAHVTDGGTWRAVQNIKENNQQ